MNLFQFWWLNNFFVENWRDDRTWTDWENYQRLLHECGDPASMANASPIERCDAHCADCAKLSSHLFWQLVYALQNFWSNFT